MSYNDTKYESMMLLKHSALCQISPSVQQMKSVRFLFLWMLGRADKIKALVLEALAL